MTRTRKPPDHRRANHALAAIDKLGGPCKGFTSYAASLPGMVRSNGLGQAVAIVMSAAGREGGQRDAWERLLDALEKWLCDDCPWSPYKQSPAEAVPSGRSRAGERLLRLVVAGNREQLIVGTTEAIAYLGWLKKLAAALVPEPGPSPNLTAEQAGVSPL